MNLINQQDIYSTWAPLIESKTGITEAGKVQWLSTYCHYHSLNESAGAYNSLGVLAGMGAIAAPGNLGGGNAGFHNSALNGSGDKFPSLLPLAIQVAAKTIGFDIVPVIPLSGPTGVLSYLDYVYAGGKIGAAAAGTSAAEALALAPDMVKFKITLAGGIDATDFIVGDTTTVVNGGNTLTLKFIGFSRVDGFPIYRVISLTAATNIATYFGSAFTVTDTTVSPDVVLGTTLGAAVLVKNLEDHIQGFSGAGVSNTDNFQGPFVDGTVAYNPMSRATGESSYYKSLGLSTFTKFVEAGTVQVAASVTTEQIQDLNKQFGIDVVSMIENALVNEVSQTINKHILSRAFALGWSNHSEFAATEGSNLNLNLVISGSAATKTFIGKADTLLTVATGAGPASGTFENLSTLQRRLFSRILAGANVVANRGRRGPANFIVCNSQIASALQDISQFTFAPFTNSLTQNNGTLYPVGSIAGMTVYVDQNMQYADTRILIGRKGGDDEPGLKFMPYMMAESIQTISEGTMSPKIAVKSRYSLVDAGHHPQTMYFTLWVDLPTAGIA